MNKEIKNRFPNPMAVLVNDFSGRVSGGWRLFASVLTDEENSLVLQVISRDGGKTPSFSKIKLRKIDLAALYEFAEELKNIASVLMDQEKQEPK